MRWIVGGRRPASDGEAATYAAWMASVRIVAVADTHSQHQRMRVPDGDVLIHAGDLTHGGTYEQLEKAATWMRGLPHKEKVVIAGNHDFGLQDQPEVMRPLFEGLTYLQDEAATVCGLRIWGSPWQPEFFNWAFNLPRGAALDEKWRHIPEGLDVLVTHGPPHGYGDRIYDGSRVGCADLLRHCRAKKPRLHLFGHIHEDRGEWTEGEVRFINVTVAEGSRPATVIDLSTE